MKANILIVDDEPIVLKSCEKTLSPAGFHVLTAQKAKDALELLKKDSIDLVITDLRMPEMDGVEFIRHIREIRPDIGVVVITGYPSQESLKETLSLKILDYLPKPFSPALLLDVTMRAIDAKKSIVKEIPQEETIEFIAQRLDGIIKKYKNKPGSLIPVLQEAQEAIGYLPPAVQRYIAKGLNIPVSEVHGVVSFYSFFSMQPKGRHNIRVCLGTACYVKGAEEVLKKFKEKLHVEVGEVTKDRAFSLESVRCLGACGLAPVVVVDKDTFGDVTQAKVDEILAHYTKH
ncbi:MAG: NADH-quinone oxidoreductase subunit NuoE [Thermodesulfovibrionales bacterium]|nr:NADH-quinone oxidoreductase subunit NuoE [Thermodesulfovibrionales bacterium]